MKKPALDIENIEGEFKKLAKALIILQNRFLAVAMDYSDYIDNSWGQKQIYQLRDNVLYRFFSAHLHTEILMRQHFIIESKFNQLLQYNPQKILGQHFPSNPLFDHAEQEISSIFDSILYHLVSVFDYLATLTNYICGQKKNKQDTLKWTSLAAGCRKNDNHFGQLSISQTIKSVDNKFVNKLYHYRSILIHHTAHYNRHSFTFLLGQEEKCIARFIANETFIKQFHDLKSISENNMITTKFATFWILNESIKNVTEVLFALKSEMENNKKVAVPLSASYNKETNSFTPTSAPFWEGEGFG